MRKEEKLLRQCWFIFDHFMSSDYQGAMDEEYARKINYMFVIIQEIGRPPNKEDQIDDNSES